MLALLLLLTLNLNMIESQLPVVLMHGIASDKTNMNDMQSWLQESFNLSVYNIDIGNGYNTSINTPMMIQTQLLCEVISSITELSNGFNFIGMSQGGLLARAYVEKCNIPKVNNLITLVSPHGGEYNNDSLFNIINVYGPLLQSTTSFASYWRDPTKYIEYLTKCQFLPELNTEKHTENTEKYYNNIINLNNFVMVWSPIDTIIKPTASAKFSVYDSNLNVINLFDTLLYKQNTLGLKTLYDKNSLIMFETSCAHEEHKLPSCFPQLYSLMKKYLLDI